MPEPTITITDIATERIFTDYFKRRAELRDSLRFGVYPNLVRTLAIHNAFVAEYGPGGALYNKQIWDYYLVQIAPIAAYQQQMIDAAAGIVSIMQSVEAAAPGTFGI